MKFVMILVVVLGIIFAVPLVIQGIKYNELGFWLLVAFAVVSLFAMRWKMKQLRVNPPSQRPLRGPDDGP